MAIYKRAVTLFWCPKPDPNQGWEKNEEGILEPVWSCGPILPTSLIDFLEETVEEMDCEDNKEQEIAFDILTYSMCKIYIFFFKEMHVFGFVLLQ